MIQVLFVLATIGFLTMIYTFFGISFKFKSVDNQINFINKRTQKEHLESIIRIIMSNETNKENANLYKRIEETEKTIAHYRNGLDRRINDVEVKIKSLEILLGLLEGESFPTILESVKEDILYIRKGNLDHTESRISNTSPDFFDIIEGGMRNMNMNIQNFSTFPLYGFNPIPTIDFIENSILVSTGTARNSQLQRPTQLIEEVQYMETPNEIDLELID